MFSPARTSRRTSRAAGLLTVTALLAAAAQVLPGAVPAAQAATTEAPVTGPQALPFDMPAQTDLRASPKKVFAHYLSSLTVSLDNQMPATDYYARNYLTPTGEGGVHAAYGGFLRNRPIGRAPIATSDWRLQDFKTEVRQAAAAGIDGFSFDVLQMQNGSVPQLWENAKLMMQAAAATDPGFKVMIMPDLAGSLSSKDPAGLAAGVAALGSYSSAYRLDDGRLVVSPFKAEAHDATWWTTFMTTMQVTYNQPVALLPVFVGNEQTYAPSFAPISYGMSNWGSRNAAYNDPTLTTTGSPKARAAKIKSLGQKWMQPVALQDERPNQAVFDEAGGTDNLRASWQLARETGADLVQIPTWNDYTENTEIAPSSDSGWSPLDLMSYYVSWYKTGTAPAVARDTVYVTHRTQPVAALPTFAGQTSLMKLRGGTPAADTVEALTFMTAPGNVTVTVGGRSWLCAVDAGVDVCDVPLGLGTVSATTSRGGLPTASVTSPHLVTDTPYVQDLSYVIASSGRTPAPLAELPTGATVVDRVVQVTAGADTYANAGAPGTNYGTSSSLSVRGTTGAISYLRFSVPAAPAGTVLTGAQLKLRSIDDAYAASVDAETVSLTSGSWAETALTWNNRPALSGGTVATIAGGIKPSTTYLTPLAPSVVTALAGGSTLALSATGTDEARFWSEDYGVLTSRPQLVLTYTPVA